ncbi:MAG TPA: hypothetical protein VLK22_00880 [Candidatus Udaeobacter sp.]|nr:hypothetical protein [Candidatus Udaeobacter sp.]
MNKNHEYIFLVVALFSSFFFWQQTKKITDLEQKNSILQSDLSRYEYALDDANEQIEQANNNIEDAKGYAWESYDDMGTALENLETVDNINI